MADENRRLSPDWNVKRILAMVNYMIHTDAFSNILIPPELTSKHKPFDQANDADLLNTDLFGMTAIE